MLYKTCTTQVVKEAGASPGTKRFAYHCAEASPANKRFAYHCAEASPRTKWFAYYYAKPPFCDMLHRDLTLSVGTQRAMPEAQSTWTKRVGAEPNHQNKHSNEVLEPKTKKIAMYT